MPQKIEWDSVVKLESQPPLHQRHARSVASSGCARASDDVIGDESFSSCHTRDGRSVVPREKASELAPAETEIANRLAYDNKNLRLLPCGLAPWWLSLPPSPSPRWARGLCISATAAERGKGDEACSFQLLTFSASAAKRIAMWLSAEKQPEGANPREWPSDRHAAPQGNCSLQLLFTSILKGTSHRSTYQPAYIRRSGWNLPYVFLVDKLVKILLSHRHSVSGSLLMGKVSEIF